MSGKSGVYWTTMVEQLNSQMDEAIKDANADAVESVLRLQRSVCPHLDWSNAFIQAVKTGHTEIVRAMLRTKPNVNLVDDAGRRPLHYAAEIGSGDIVKQILNAGSPVNVCDSQGATALHIAAEMGQSTATVVLLSEGAKVNRPKLPQTGESPLHVACRKGRVEIVKLMLARGGLVNSETTDGLTPLHLASRAKQLEVARVLCVLGAKVNQPDEKGKSPLYYAADVGSSDMVRLLLEHGAYLVQPDKRNRTPLHYLAAANPPTVAQEKVVDVFVEHMSPEDLNMQDNKGCTALHHASSLGNAKIARVLIAAGAGLNIADSGGETPLNTAIGHKRVAVVKMLVLAGADVNIPDNSQAYPLHNVHSLRGEEKVSLVELLVKHGAKLNVLTVRGYTPLDRCVFHYVIGNYNKKEILKILVKAGAKLKPVTGPGHHGRPQHNSPLCFLTWHNHISSGQFLVNAGWDLRNETWLGLPGKTQAAETFMNTLRQQIQEAPSLWNECRRTIREVLLERSEDSDIEGYIGKLPLPSAVKRQLLFQTEIGIFDATEST